MNLLPTALERVAARFYKLYFFQAKRVKEVLLLVYDCYRLGLCKELYTLLSLLAPILQEHHNCSQQLNLEVVSWEIGSCVYCVAIC